MNKNIHFTWLDFDIHTVHAFLSSILKLEDFSKIKGLSSNYIKFAVYARVFNMEYRHKYTGFENLSALDQKARQKIKSCKIMLPPKATENPRKYTNSKRQTLFYDSNTENTSAKLFKQLHHYQKKFAKFHGLDENSTIEDAVAVYKKYLLAAPERLRGQQNVVYISGGIDSELVAWSFVEAGVDFVPVIFRYVDAQGKYLNDHDTEWAFKFCNNHDLIPVVRDFNIEEFWESDDLLEIAKKHKEPSPQLCAYNQMIELVHKEIQDVGFENFCANPNYRICNTVAIDFVEYSEDNIQQLAPDIWAFPLLTELSVNDLLDNLDNAEWNLPQGDNVPIREISLDQIDPVFCQALINYVETYIDSFYWKEYANQFLKVFNVTITKLSSEKQEEKYFFDHVKLHHNLSRVSMCILLNDDFEGGEIHWPRQKYTSKNVSKGTLICWPGQITHPQEVFPVKKGARYALHLWTKLEYFSTREQQLKSI